MNVFYKITFLHAIKLLPVHRQLPECNLIIVPTARFKIIRYLQLRFPRSISSAVWCVSKCVFKIHLGEWLTEIVRTYCFNIRNLVAFIKISQAHRLHFCWHMNEDNFVRFWFNLEFNLKLNI